MKKKPALVCVNETLLSKSCQTVKLEGFELVHRLDRRADKKGGGVLVFAALEIKGSVTFLREGGDKDERIWFLVHTNGGPLLMCAWYRPPGDPVCQDIMRFECELQEMRADFMGLMILGDVNVHHQAWLVHSSHTSAAGRQLRQVAREANLDQHVKEPTRGPHTLDLVLSDLGAKARVTARIADHSLLEAWIDIKVPEETTVTRKVWRYADADWKGLHEALEAQDWTEMERLSPGQNGCKTRYWATCRPGLGSEIWCKRKAPTHG